MIMETAVGTNDISIKTAGLKKVFVGIAAVDGLNLEVHKGELFGLVGPDGAGKTTTMRLLTGIMEPTAGEAWVSGRSILTEAELIREKIGYMSQRFGLYEDLTVIENIDFYADIYEVTKKERPERIERLLGFSNLTEFRNRLAGRLSGGMKQKLGLACALIHTPEVLFLDEPTNGVDPVSRRDFWRILYELLTKGVTIFVSTAYLDEAERCARVCLMHMGKVIMEGSPSAIKRSLGVTMIEMWADEARAAADVIRQMEGVRSVSLYGNKLHVALFRRESLRDLQLGLDRHGIVTQGHREVLPSVEDVFIASVEAQGH